MKKDQGRISTTPASHGRGFFAYSPIVAQGVGSNSGMMK